MQADELAKWRHAGELARDALQYGRKLIVVEGDVLVVARRAAGKPLDLGLPGTPELILSTEPDGSTDGPSVTLWRL